MMKFVALSCALVAATANALPAADPGYGTVTGTVRKIKCSGEYEEIETQSCVPKKENVCEEKEVDQDILTFKKDCKEVTSKDCKPERVIYKREAEAFYGGLGYGGYGGLGYGGYGGYAAAAPAVHGYAAPAAGYAALTAAPHQAGKYDVAPATKAYDAAPAALATHAAVSPVVSDHVDTLSTEDKVVLPGDADPKTVVTIKSDCREVTKEVCVDTPQKESKKVKVETCHVKQTVDCKMIKKRIPKKDCEPVEEKIITPHVPAPAGSAPAETHQAAPAPAPHAAALTAGFGGYGSGRFGGYWG